MKVYDCGQVAWQAMTITWGLLFKAKNSLPRRVEATDMLHFSRQISGKTLTLRWHGHAIIGNKFEVKVIWKNKDDLLSGRIGWTGGSKDAVIEETYFPVATMPLRANACIFNALEQGRLYEIEKMPPGRTVLLDRILGNIASGSMQFSALTSPSGSYYFDTRDINSYRKSYEYHSVDNRAKARFIGIHPLPLDGHSNLRYTLPYSVSIGRFRGGWFEAAQIYKKWARRQKWAARLPVNNRLRNIGVWAWNRGLAENVIAPVEKLQRDAGVPAALDWYWWHKNGYDTSYPYYWPPREDLNVFRQAVARLNKQGIFTQVYLNGVTWDMDGGHWNQGGSQSAVLNSNGEVKATMFNHFAKRRLAWMCGNDSGPFQKKLRNTIAKLRKTGLPGVYLDMIGCASYGCCYNPAHRHAPGGGYYQVRGYRRMLKQIMRDNPGLLLSTEEPSEAYMDLFDSSISLSGGAERLWGNNVEPVPAFSAVYHGLNALFGNYALPDAIPPFDPKWPAGAAWKKEKAWHRLFPDQFFLEFARTVTWGMQPTVANLRLRHTTGAEFRELYDYIVRTARFYHSHRDFLFDGEMMPPSTLKTRTVGVDFMQRYIFTAEGRQKVFRKKMPAVLHSLWRSPDGRLGLVLANYTQGNQRYEFLGSGLKAAGRMPPRSWLLVEQSR